MNRSDILEAYTVTLLRHERQYLLLQRSPLKAFAPLRWTGLGGHVEAEEYTTLRASALREVEEESGILPGEIANYVLRRALLVNRPRQPFAVLFYFTGELGAPVTPACPEGTLSWKRREEFEELDIIETTQPVLDLLIEDMASDPLGEKLPVTGVAVFNREGIFQKALWANGEGA